MFGFQTYKQCMKQPVSLYIHFPYCRNKCPYCDFVSYCTPSFDIEQMLRGYRRDLSFFKDRMGDVSLSTIAFGGGTPSLMSVDQLKQVIDLVQEFFIIEDSAEVSIEVNPATVDYDTLAGYKAAGVNRLSMGLQSLWDTDLEFLGRIHNARQNREILEWAAELFPNRSADFMYALPHQTLQSWEQQLQQIVSLDLPHFSIYQLTVEEGTPFGNKYPIGVSHPFDEEMYQMTHRVLLEAGYEHYEISNFSKPGMRSNHNMVYWNGGQYIGIGPAAHSRVKFKDQWMACSGNDVVNTWETQEPECEKISVFDRAIELFMMGLRCCDGVTSNMLLSVTGLRFEDVIDLDFVQEQVQLNMLNFDGNVLTCTDQGRLYLNHILQSLFKY